MADMEGLLGSRRLRDITIAEAALQFYYIVAQLAVIEDRGQ
jgi:hypothetical protein